MNILILSEWGGGLGIAVRFISEGHKVKMWIKDKDYAMVGDGIVEKTDNYKRDLNWCDLIVTDDCGFGEISAKLKEEGHLVIGGTANTDLWESDRGAGQALMKHAGLQILPSQEFKTVEDAITYVKENPGLYVVKPDGKSQENKALTYVGQREDGSDLVAVLEHCKKQKVKSLELQKKIAGVEVGCSGYFNGHDFCDPIEVSFEHKKFLNGDLGPNTGEMGTTMFWTNKNAPIYKATIEKLIPYLELENYTGYFDINCIVEGKNIWPLEMTCRFGYPTNNLISETITDNLGEFYFELAEGRRTEFKTSNPVSAVVCLTIAPFPYEDKELFKRTGKDTLILLPKDMSGVWFMGLRKENNSYFQALQDGSVVNCAGSGKTITEALKMAYDRVKSVTVPDPIYRTDIGHSWDSDLFKLNTWNWL